MFAARYEKTGPAADVFILEQVDTPDPGEGQVRVKIVLSGVNPTDYKGRNGAVPRTLDGFQIPHHDGSGVIDAVGAGVDPQRVGERVWVMLAAAGNRYGTAAEFCIVNAEYARTLPDTADFELGATLGVPAITAAYCLFSDGPIAGQTVLVHGGAGAVGRAAIELAVWAGARVIATVSSDSKAQTARDAGAQIVVNYTDSDAVEQLTGHGISRIIEVNLAANLELDIAIAQPGMKIICYAADGPDPVLPRRALMTACITIEFMLLYNVKSEKFWQSVNFVEDALEQGALTLPPNRVLALTEIAEAHDLVEAGSERRLLLQI